MKSGKMLCHVNVCKAATCCATCKNVARMYSISPASSRMRKSRQEKDPHKHKPAPNVMERVYQSVYYPKAWLSIPVDMWVLSVNSGVLLVVIALQTLDVRGLLHMRHTCQDIQLSY